NLLFVGIGRRREGGDVHLVNDQVRPLRGIGSQMIELNGVSEDIQAGDELGLVIYGIHPYYLYLGGLVQAPLPVTLAGTVQLPLHSQP
ncbi:MAG: hypothetical protein JJ903_06625, partial [Spongiibacter sp.]